MIKISKLFKIIEKIEEGFSFFMLMFATFLVFVNVILRALGFGITWAEEGTRYIIVWLSFIGGSLCAKHGEHVGIDLLTQITPPKVTKIIVSTAQLISAVFMFVLVYYGWLMTESTMLTGQISTGVMMPMWIIYLGIPIGCFFMGLRFLQRGILTIRAKHDVSVNDDLDDDNDDVDISRL